MLIHRLISAIRRSTKLLPRRQALKALTWIDKTIGATEVENIYLPGVVAARRNRVAVDVGANNGVTTEIMAAVFQQVHAFEANPRLFESLNGAVSSNVRIWGFALSSKAGHAVLSVPVSKGVVLEGWGSISQPLVDACDSLESSQVETRTLDSMDLEPVDFIKIDVEGHELEVLQGARNTIVKNLPWIVVEALGEQQDKVRRWLVGLGYVETQMKVLAGMEGSHHNLIFAPPNS